MDSGVGVVCAHPVLLLWFSHNGSVLSVAPLSLAEYLYIYLCLPQLPLCPVAVIVPSPFSVPHHFSVYHESYWAC